ncbi:MAG: DUF2442 domain-containing protein [Leptospiraceae bacterium]|nr:DUF2442 domain-containing protein [Leptospiraceae bacterium]MCP5496775.1 DUF2442 domain-containing protein [Leptospiraceae bacterium]
MSRQKTLTINLTQEIEEGWYKHVSRYYICKTKKKILTYLKFENGISGVINLEKLIVYEGVFEPLKDWNYFKQVKVNQDLGTVCWLLNFSAT